MVTSDQLQACKMTNAQSHNWHRYKADFFLHKYVNEFLRLLVSVLMLYTDDTLGSKYEAFESNDDSCV